jgi:hypothetical protein
VLGQFAIAACSEVYVQYLCQTVKKNNSNKSTNKMQQSGGWSIVGYGLAGATIQQ